MRIWIFLFPFSLLFAGCASHSSNTSATQPNIIFIYADDLGYGDLSCYNPEGVQTPYLDQMAADGIRFTDFYSTSPICSPSRAGLLTGRYQVRSGITRVFFPNSLQGLESGEKLISEVLKEQGYTTGLVGKWHLGHLSEFLPMEQGFDYWFGLPYSNDMEWEPRKDPPLPLMRNGKVIAQPVNQKELTQRYTAEAVNFIARNQDQPFFLYFAHTFPHKPLHVSAEYAGTSERHGLYGDVVKELDRSVGEVLAALDTYGLAENTLVVFSSDNGPASKGGGMTGGLRGHKATTYEGGIRVPTLAQWKGNIPAGTVVETPGIMMDWFPTFAALGGAETEQAPLDGIDITPLLLEGKADWEDRNFYFYFNEELRSLRAGKWKYMRAVEENAYPRQRLEPHPVFLFDLEADPFEQQNLANTHPDIVAQLESHMQAFEQGLGEVPAPKLKAVPFDDPRKK